MSISQIFSGMEISSSGLTGERLRMEVAANNIANINSTTTPEGGPYQRQQVTFSAEMNRLGTVRKPGVNNLHGVKVLGVTPDVK